MLIGCGWFQHNRGRRGRGNGSLRGAKLYFTSEPTRDKPRAILPYPAIGKGNQYGFCHSSDGFYHRTERAEANSTVGKVNNANIE
jgi:hypothetical protein